MALSAHDTEIRPNHIWAGDAGQIAAGKAGEVYMLKTGQKEPEDLSDNEAVQMGLVMQEPVMRAAAGRWGLEFKDADYHLIHPRHTFLASHFDYIVATERRFTRSRTLGTTSASITARTVLSRFLTVTGHNVCMN
jgi:hypothetical protein